MKQILFFIFLTLSVSLNANEKSDKLADSLHSFGNNGEYAQMDSIYNLITHENHYRQDKLYALNISLDYARFLNQKGDYEKAHTLLTEIRENAMVIEKYPGNTIAQQLQEIAAIATYEIAFGQWQSNPATGSKKNGRKSSQPTGTSKRFRKSGRSIQSFRSHTPQTVYARQRHLTLQKGACYY